MFIYFQHHIRYLISVGADCLLFWTSEYDMAADVSTQTGKIEFDTMKRYIDEQIAS